MRLSEKTIELNFCAQLNALTKRQLLWFGLTQKQEARAGFDAFTRMGGRLIVFQFKASNKTVRGCRRFGIDHGQMDNLRKRCKAISRSVFYVFPLVGTSAELSLHPDLVSQTWLLDVMRLTSLGMPTTSKGTIRKNGIHYIDVTPGTAIIHSDPVEIRLLNAVDIGRDDFQNTEGINILGNQDFDTFWNFRRFLLPVSAAVVV